MSDRRLQNLGKLAKTLIVIASVGGLFVMTDGGFAQPTNDRIDPVMERAKTDQAIKKFADLTLPIQERLAAAEQIGHVSTKEAIDQLSGIFRDPQQTDAVRMAALRRIPKYSNTRIIDDIIAVIQDPQNGGTALKVAAIKELEVIDGFTEAGHQSDAKILAAWRSALSHPMAEVRKAAMAPLALRNDPDAVSILGASLKGTSDTGFTSVEAIRFLSVADVTQHFELIRPKLKANDPETRMAAISVLAIDQQSRDEIRDILRNSDQPVAVQMVALDALSHHDPNFAQYAVELARDERLDPSLRAESIQTLGRSLRHSEMSVPMAKTVRDTFRSLSDDVNPQIKDAARMALQ